MTTGRGKIDRQCLLSTVIRVPVCREHWVMDTALPDGEQLVVLAVGAHQLGMNHNDDYLER